MHQWLNNIILVFYLFQVALKVGKVEVYLGLIVSGVQGLKTFHIHCTCMPHYLCPILISSLHKAPAMTELKSCNVFLLWIKPPFFSCLLFIDHVWGWPSASVQYHFLYIKWGDSFCQWHRPCQRHSHRQCHCDWISPSCWCRNWEASCCLSGKYCCLLCKWCGLVCLNFRNKKLVTLFIRIMLKLRL